MYIRRLSLTDFRNHEDTAIDIDAAMIVLAGENGAGKTNILEAVSLLSPGRGLRRAALLEMARQAGGGGFGISARLAATPRGVADLSLGTAIEVAVPARRKVNVNGAAAAAAVLGEWLSVLWLTPAMDRLFVEGSGARRRFLDRLVLALYPGHGAHATRYEAAMRARNRLLCEERGGEAGWLDALEDAMATHGAAIDCARRDLVAALATAASEVADGPFARPELALAGEIQGGWGSDALRTTLAKSRRRDARAGRTMSGPHRDDLQVSHGSSGRAAGKCSTGEQKALLLGLVLAHGDLIAARRGQRPILLLDEVAAHLDPLRRAALFTRLENDGGQVWMTGTEASLFDAVSASATRLRVSEGIVTRA